MSANTPTSSSTPVCCHCQEAKQTLKYVLPVPGGKKEFCSESCLTGYRKGQKTNGEVDTSTSTSTSTSSSTAGQDSSASAPLSNGESKLEEVQDKPPPLSAEKERTEEDASTSSEKGETSKTDQSQSHVSPVQRKSSSSSESESSFSWRDYLKDSSAVAAPPAFFKQRPEPPENEFIIGGKLEARDPRSQMACIATVIGLQGPRVRLRLDGSDTKNDFWKMVDDNELHEIGHCKLPLYLTDNIHFIILKVKKTEECCNLRWASLSMPLRGLNFWPKH